MAKLGSRKRPAVVRVRTVDRAEKIMNLCNEHGWMVVVGIEDDKPEDISDVERLLNSTGHSPNSPTTIATPKIGRNAPCPCGSGLKYKKCCGKGGNYK
jgi:SWIM/SEC-C metal-binding protein